MTTGSNENSECVQILFALIQQREREHEELECAFVNLTMLPPKNFAPSSSDRIPD